MLWLSFPPSGCLTVFITATPGRFYNNVVYAKFRGLGFDFAMHSLIIGVSKTAVMLFKQVKGSVSLGG